MSCVGDVIKFECACLALEHMANVLAKVVRDLENVIDIMEGRPKGTV